MTLLIGCPIQKREWMINEWFDATEVAAQDHQHEYLFVLDADEQPLNDMIDAHGRHGPIIHKIHVPEAPREDTRTWNKARLERMTELRNLLLQGVRNRRPEHFLSLDSDILMHPNGINALYEMLDGDYAAVGGKAYMTPKGLACPSYAMLGRQDKLTRLDRSDNRRVDVIMAIKLMTPPAYFVDYVYHQKGEDIGWSKAAGDQGLLLGWRGDTVNRHVMKPEFLNEVDPRC